MTKLLIIPGLLLTCQAAFAQRALKVISSKEVNRIETILAADSMQGRKPGTAGIEKAADFITAEFIKTGLQTFNNANGYRQPFTMIKPTQTSISAVLDGQAIDAKNIAVVTSVKELKLTATSGYKQVMLKAGSNLLWEAEDIMRGKQNTIVFADTSYAKSFARLQRKRYMFKSPYSFVFILSNNISASYAIEATHNFETQDLANIVGVLPGKSKKDEYVIFSGHYDHLGISKAVKGDSIYNGANDDAAGTTAVMMLAKYYKKLDKNERTIIFAAFTAEESGGFGSQYFSQQLNPAKVMAMFNIEMIGTESKWGKSSAYITGYERTDMGAILEQNLKGSGFKFYPDPYPTQQLFFRSDNATLARLGVPAHTISTSKMDSEPNYHQLSDEVTTLDINNMAEIIKAIAISATSIVSGKDTPSRVDTATLQVLQ